MDLLLSLLLVVICPLLTGAVKSTLGRRTVATVALLIMLIGLLVVLVGIRLAILLRRRVATLLRVRALLRRIALRRRSVASRCWRTVLVGVLVVLVVLVGHVQLVFPI